MRVAKEAAREIKAIDSETAVTETYIRRLIREGTIPHVDVGRKKLINLDLLLEYLNGSNVKTEAEQIPKGIRRIQE